MTFSSDVLKETGESNIFGVSASTFTVILSLFYNSSFPSAASGVRQDKTTSVLLFFQSLTFVCLRTALMSIQGEALIPVLYNSGLKIPGRISTPHL